MYTNFPQSDWQVRRESQNVLLKLYDSFYTAFLIEVNVSFFFLGKNCLVTDIGRLDNVGLHLDILGDEVWWDICYMTLGEDREFGGRLCKAG